MIKSTQKNMAKTRKLGSKNGLLLLKVFLIKEVIISFMKSINLLIVLILILNLIYKLLN